MNLLAFQGTLKSLLQHHSSKASILQHSACFTIQLSHPHMTTGKTVALTRRTFVGKVLLLPFNTVPRFVMCFPDITVGKEFTCNAGDPGSIPGLGRTADEGIGYPLQYSWASLVAQLVKNLSAMWETWVGSLGWEDPLERGKATHSSILAWRIPWTV